MSSDRIRLSIGTHPEPSPPLESVPAPTPAGRDVRLEGISKSFGAVWALRPTSMSVLHGEFFSLLGASGSGKTTTLRIIGGFEMPTAGRVYLQERDVTDSAPYERAVNTVFQDYALFPHMTVQENVAYGLRVRRVPKREIARRVGEMLELVRLSGFERRRPSQLSGGQRQRVALARALVNVPAVLLLDEPLGALDLKLRREMQAELRRIQRDVGITFVYVTHDQEEAMSMSDRIAVMRDGRIEQIGAPSEIYERPQSAFVAGFVGVSNLLPGIVVDRDGEGYTLEVPGCGRVRGCLGRDQSIGESMVVAVRPEKIRLLPAEDVRSGANSLHGRIEDLSYGGAFTRYTVKVGDQEIAVVEQNRGTGPASELGEEVWLSWEAGQTLPLSGTEDDLRQSDSARA